ncbi:hypothetical protein E2C01_014375 [Portunus trituberculatus]|uniref:Uncharacterized protein n=1 Tax=Portunus trituberculatus TaxID=210409 RepID=A0A5B7DJ05_PORTR|nr:hypothetical protein [Portunus trituberculatus]
MQGKGTSPVQAGAGVEGGVGGLVSGRPRQEGEEGKAGGGHEGVCASLSPVSQLLCHDLPGGVLPHARLGQQQCQVVVSCQGKAVKGGGLSHGYLDGDEVL